MNQACYIRHLAPQELDALLATGWRHFGYYFFRYSHDTFEGVPTDVLPLRIDLQGFELSKKFRKIKSKNRHFTYVIKPIEIDEAKEQLFYNHARKYKRNVPQTIYSFLNYSNPATEPIEAVEVSVYDGEKLIACSFLDIGAEATSSIYAMYDLAYSAYSLGYYTILLEIEYAQKLGKKFYYHGYAHSHATHYDYKKCFPNLYYYHWQQEQWLLYEPIP
jgi:leucyl-tRNA---protein transferase